MVRSTGPASAESGVAPEAGEWPRLLGRFDPRRERPLPEADAPPLAELVADIPVGAGQSEAEGLVQPHARRIRQGDRRDRLGEALRLEQWDQCAVESAADAAPLRCRIEIDARLDREAVSGPGTKGRRISVTEDAIRLVAGDEPGVERTARFDPASDLVLVGRLGLERDRAGGYIRRVDRGDRRRVVRGGEPQLHPQSAASSRPSSDEGAEPAVRRT